MIKKSVYSSLSMKKKRDFVKKLPTGFEPGTSRLQIRCLTPRLREMIQRDGGRYNMKQVLKSANSFESTHKAPKGTVELP